MCDDLSSCFLGACCALCCVSAAEAASDDRRRNATTEYYTSSPRQMYVQPVMVTTVRTAPPNGYIYVDPNNSNLEPGTYAVYNNPPASPVLVAQPVDQVAYVKPVNPSQV